MKIVSIFFLTISTFCWKETECKKIKMQEVVAELVDIAEGRTKHSCFKEFGKMYENLHELNAMYSDELIDNSCISSFKEVLDVMRQDKKRFHERSDNYEKLKSLASCRIFFNLVHKKKRLYKKMAKMTDSHEQEKYCLQQMRQSHEELIKMLVKVVKTLRKMKKGQYTKMGLEKILKVKTIPIAAFSE